MESLIDETSVTAEEAERKGSITSTKTTGTIKSNKSRKSGKSVISGKAAVTIKSHTSLKSNISTKSDAMSVKSGATRRTNTSK